MKVATIVGTRPEIIRLSRVIAELDRHFDHVLVHTGQNFDYELNEIFFKELEIRAPNYYLEAAGVTAAQTIGNVIARSDELLREQMPDAVLILGDTNSALASISAKRLKIPIFHMEAGNRCFDFRVPEEINRRIVDHISDINLPYTDLARRYLVQEGIRSETVIVTGSPMREVLEYYRPKIEASTVFADLGLTPGKYFVVSAHREENVDDPSRLGTLLQTLDDLAGKFGHPIIVSTHPRTRRRIEGREANSQVRFLKPLGFPAYVRLQQMAACVLSDSGTITEESSILDFPAVTIRDVHERPEGMDESAVVMCGLESANVLPAVEMVMSQHRGGGQRSFHMVTDYMPDNVSRKVARIIQSYTGYVNNVVWKKGKGC